MPKLTTEEFNRFLTDVLQQDYTTTQLLAIPGVYEVLSEELNNEVITAWENYYDVDFDPELHG